MTFVDTNIFVRYLTKDNPAKAQACYELFKQAAANQITYDRDFDQIPKVSRREP